MPSTASPAKGKTSVAKTNCSNLKVGDKLSQTSYYTVKKVKNKESIVVTDDSGLDITVEGKALIQGMDCASQFTNTVKCSRTELANIFAQNARVVMSVNWNLKVDQKDVLTQIQDLYPNKGKIVSKTDFDKGVKEAISQALQGVERTAIGRHYGQPNEFGRYQFVDMEKQKDQTKEYDSRFIQVDPRTINWLVVGGTRYEL